jgi:HPt (histidine-containing phosphotransfer) domain-containing protein
MMDINKCAENLGLEKEEFVELLVLFVETAHADLDKLQRALSVMDGNQAMAVAHSIKGAAANLGLTALYEAAKEAEHLACRKELMRIPVQINRLRGEIEVVAALARC